MIQITKNRNYAHCSLAVLVLAIVLQIYSLTALNESIEVAVTRPLAFFLKSKVVKEDLDPRIKIFAMDDRTVSGLGTLDLDLATWSSVIEAVSRRLPKAVFIDKLFDKIYSSEEISAFKAVSPTWYAPIYPIVFVYPGKIPFRTTISDLKFPTQLQSLTSERFPTLPSSNLSLYGAVPELLSSFNAAGHTVYNGDGKGSLLFRTEDGQVVPHLGLLGANTIAFDSGLLINNIKVPSDKNFEFIVSFLPKDRFLKRSFSLLEVVTAAQKSKKITPINEGDFVFILPAMFTGNTDWRETPFGSMPGGYYGISVLNSVLTGNWIRNIKDPGFAILLGSLLLIFLGYKSSPTRLIALTSVLIVGVLVAALLLFVFANILISWLPLTVGMTMNLVILVIGINQDASLEKLRLDGELATAKIVHHTFFPPVKFSSKHLELVSFYESSTECGGDWWMHSTVSSEVEYVLIGDAVGHGVPAALVASVAFAVNSTFKQLKNKDRLAMPGPSEFLDILGSVLESMKSRNAVMTFQVAKFDFVAGTMELANAGHTFPVILPENEQDDRLKPGKKTITVRLSGNPLGLDIKSEYKVKSTNLRPGDRIVFYSDGIIENRGGNDSSPLKLAGLTAIIETAAKSDIESMKKDILKGYLAHVGKVPRDDDATLVCVGYQKLT